MTQAPPPPHAAAVVARNSSPPLYIDWHNPVQNGDVPYLLYPVYSARGASLYFIGRMNNDVVRLAIMAH